MRRLPPGPHGLPPELVERNQRERLIAAMAEVAAERGYVEASVAEVAKHAGVSTATFYRQFKDKRECMLVSFEALFGRLLEALEGACEQWGNVESRAAEGARFVGAILAEDVPAARLLSIEILSVGPNGVRVQHEAIERLAALLRGPEAAAALDAAWVGVAAMTSLVGRRLAEERLPDPDELAALAEAAILR
ncbi:MAG: TetR/AcrR family transcriptional regulator [Thermoleophilia bacterium]